MKNNLFDYRKLEAVRAIYPAGSLIRLEPNGILWRVKSWDDEGYATLSQRSLPDAIKRVYGLDLHAH